MLEQLFGSKARLKILRLFLIKEGPFYVREISKKTKLQLNGVRRELKNLEQLGLLEIIERKSQKKYYQVNKEFILYPELKALINKSQLILRDSLIRKIQKIGRISLLILTGFFANNPESKTDVLVVGQINRRKLASLIRKMEKKLDKKIYYTIMSPQEFKFRKDLTDRFLFNILEGRKVVLIDKYRLEGK